MADEHPKKSSNLPFTPIPMSTANPPAKTTKLKTGTKGYSKRKQIKMARKDDVKQPVSVRRVLLGIVILLAITITGLAIFAPHKLEAAASGEFLTKTETCTVTETNSSNFFDTTCGKFEWKDELEPVTFPQDELVEGETYTFESIGLRIAPAQVFPTIQSYTQGAATK